MPHAKNVHSHDIEWTNAFANMKFMLYVTYLIPFDGYKTKMSSLHHSNTQGGWLCQMCNHINARLNVH